jgi:HEAT repeat protein
MKSRGIQILRSACLQASVLVLAAGCATNVNDSLAELKYGDTESVQQAVVDLGEILSQKEASNQPYDEGDKEAIAYLEDLAAKSPDDVIRASAISSLGRLERTDSTGIFAAALTDASAHWVVRLEAARAIRTRPRPQAAGAVARQLADEPRMEVRFEIIKAAQAVGGDEALKSILDFFLDRSRRSAGLRLSAYNAARALSGKDFEFEDTARWEEYRDQRFPGKGSAPDPASSSDGKVAPATSTE